MKTRRSTMVLAVLLLLLCAASWRIFRVKVNDLTAVNDVPAGTSRVVDKARAVSSSPPPHEPEFHRREHQEQTARPGMVAKPAAEAARIELPPPNPGAPGSTSTVASPRRRMTDRRTNQDPRVSREEVDKLEYAVETLDEDVEDCLVEWRKSQVTPTGEVMLAIQIDGKGIQKAWVQHDGGVPLGPRSCFANAAYGIDWSHMVASPAEITRRYSFPSDGGS